MDQQIDKQQAAEIIRPFLKAIVFYVIVSSIFVCYDSLKV